MSAYQATGDKSEYEVALGLLLRAERERQGLSLAGVEEKSRGRWKAVVVGTWERAERSITVGDQHHRPDGCVGFLGHGSPVQDGVQR